MKSPAEHNTIQIELTSACVLRCTNCTRFCGTHQVPFFLSWEDFKKAVDSLVGYSKLPHALVGFMGGEPLLHPDFIKFCEYAQTKIPREKLGLWSTFPDGPKYKTYAETICKTFSCILLNDHKRDDILHAPVLMASEDYFKKECPTCHGDKSQKFERIYQTKDEISVPGGTYLVDYGEGDNCPRCNGVGLVTDMQELLFATDHCWVQESWSSSINPKGAFFCEVAAALSEMFDGPEGWPVEEGWWKRTPMDFKEQREWACTKCGAAMPISRLRNSQDNRDDVSVSNLERLKAIKSRKIAKGEYVLREEFKFDGKLLENHGYPTQTYKEAQYRQRIAAKYGILLVMNNRGYWEPTIMPEDYTPPLPPQEGLHQIYKSRYSEEVAK